MGESGGRLDWIKLLKGKVYSDSERKVEFKEGRNVRFYVKTERPLTRGDVLSVRIDGSNVIFTTTDGKKYTEDVIYKPADDQVKRSQVERRVKRERKVS